MFGWIDSSEGKILSVSVKTPLENPEHDPIVLGTFIFRRADDFRRSLDRLIAREEKVNGEYYIDSLINDAIEIGLNCQLLRLTVTLLRNKMNCIPLNIGDHVQVESLPPQTCFDHRVPSMRGVV